MCTSLASAIRANEFSTELWLAARANAEGIEELEATHLELWRRNEWYTRPVATDDGGTTCVADAIFEVLAKHEPTLDDLELTPQSCTLWPWESPGERTATPVSRLASDDLLRLVSRMMRSLCCDPVHDPVSNFAEFRKFLEAARSRVAYLSRHVVAKEYVAESDARTVIRKSKKVITASSSTISVRDVVDAAYHAQRKKAEYSSDESSSEDEEEADAVDYDPMEEAAVNASWIYDATTLFAEIDCTLCALSTFDWTIEPRRNIDAFREWLITTIAASQESTFVEYRRTYEYGLRSTPADWRIYRRNVPENANPSIVSVLAIRNPDALECAPKSAADAFVGSKWGLRGMDLSTDAAMMMVSPKLGALNGTIDTIIDEKTGTRSTIGRVDSRTVTAN